MASAPVPSIDCPEPILGPNAQGIERVGVDDAAGRLIVTFARPIGDPTSALLRATSYTLTGGQRLFPRVRSVARHEPPGTRFDLIGRRVALDLDSVGDFSIYTLTVSAPDVDPFFASRRLRFRLACDDPFDCREPVAPREPEPEQPVSIDYLAKDYVSFRQALIDFIPTRMPGWTERSEADIGMMLLELFAHTADELSYLQDRVANEAFIATASQRRSVAGHLALIGYRLDEGAAAWTWLQLTVTERHTLVPEQPFKVRTRRFRDDEPVIVFATVAGATLDPDLNELAVYDWGNERCCLPRSASSVTLVGRHEQIAVGDRLLIEDRDAERLRRDVVRVAEIAFTRASGTKPELTTVHWSPTTPLRHEYCVADSLVVRGNLVLATHGDTVTETVRSFTTEEAEAIERARAERDRTGGRAPRQRLRLERGPLAHLDPATVALLQPNGDLRSPAMEAGPGAAPATVSTLELTVAGERWSQRPTLIESGADDRVYRLEIDDAGDTTIVFGDGRMGAAPNETDPVLAGYRIGGGPAGNVAADVLTVPIADAPGQLGWLDPDRPVRNPLPAVGGRAPESRQHARRTGPASFLTPLVAVTTADYQAAAVALELEGSAPIQRARATFRWTGSWLTVTLAVDPRGSDAVTATLRRALLGYLDTRRLVGYDLEVVPAVYVSIDLEIAFCTADGFRPADVEQALLHALSDEAVAGERGVFHPDALSFGDRLFVSRIYAVVIAVPGVASAEIVRLSRSRSPRPAEETAANLRQGYLAVGANEIVRLDNDRDFPENGTLRLVAKGAA